MKRKILTGLASLTLLDIAAGHAADVAKPVYKAPQPVAVAPTWTGWYLGGHVGYRWTGADLVAPSYVVGLGGFPSVIPGFKKAFDLDGVIGGAHLGYNWQIDRNRLIGIEGDVSSGRSKDSVGGSGIIPNDLDAFTFRHNSELTLHWQASIRVRAGYIVETWLWYVTGGVAFERAKWVHSVDLAETVNVDSSASSSFRTAKTLTGWVIGAGVEQMFHPNWTWRLEYLYENFGDFTVPYGFTGAPLRLDMDEVHKVRFGITYKFGEPSISDIATGSRIKF